ncbi:MAG: TolC family protein [Sandaracinaceae bacterium]
MPRAVLLCLLSLLAALALLPAPSVAAQPASPPSGQLETPSPPGPDLDLLAILHGEGEALSGDLAARRAVDTAPPVARAMAAVRQAGAASDRATYAFLPQVGLNLRYTRLSPVTNTTVVDAPAIDPSVIDGLVAGVDDPDAQALWRATLGTQLGFADFRFPIFLNQYAMRASLSYPISDVLLSVWPAAQAAEATVMAARRRLEDARLQVALEAREAFYEYARARGAWAIARLALLNAQARLEQVDAFVALGTAAEVDQLRLRAQVASAEVAVVRSRAAVEVAANTLRTLLHVDDDVQLAVEEDVLAPLPPLTAANADLVERAKAQRPDARAIVASVRAAERQARSAEGSRYPSLGVNANLDVANPNPRVFPQTDEFQGTWDISAVLTWSMHDILDGNAQAEEAWAARDQRAEELRVLEDGIRIQVVEAATSYRAAREALEAALLGVVAADEGYRVNAVRFEEGAITATDLIQSNVEQVQAQLDVLNAGIDGRLARARLTRAVGRDVVAEGSR